ncbi:MAG: ABC transporter ATP-binding protein/permease [Alicyclobacillus sp.]|nr:ABC transporter ATP-binding protein/permease [Alicyclobacillus sp.]
MRLLPFARRYVWHFAIIIALVVIFNTTSVLQPYLVKVAIDSDIAAKNYSGLVWIAASYVGVVLIGAMANYAQMVMLQFAGQSIIRQIRITLFRHILSQSMAFFDRTAIGRLVTIVSNDTETVSQFFTQFFLSSVRDGLSLVMIVIAMFRLNVRIAGECMILIPIIFAISQLFRSRMRQAYQLTRSRLSNVIAFLAENLAGIRIIQIFHQERRQRQAFEERNRLYREATISAYTYMVFFNRSLDFLGNLAVAAMVWVGGHALLHHAIHFGVLFAFINYIRNFFGPINSITQQWNNLQSSAVAADRIGRVLQVEPEVREPDVPAPVKEHEMLGRVTFEHVSFGYKPGELVLKDINFTIEPGQFVGFVGATGAGKSSVMSLLARFYDVTSGKICLDGVDIRHINLQDLHRYIGIVQQDVNLFSGTVLDNIRLFREEISDAQVIAAAKTVGAHEMIERLPNGYHTHLYAKGANLSMGERQLVSFARIVALNPRVLILDEATANLDSQTEALVQQGLQAVAKNRTTIVIAHRLSTIRHADQIIVMQRGEIIEQGTHEALVALGGYYAELHAKSGIEAEANQDQLDVPNHCVESALT